MLAVSALVLPVVLDGGAATLAVEEEPPTAYMLDNGRIRFGGGGQSSTSYSTVNSFVPSGMPAQPFYRSSSENWFKLTFSSAQLSMTVGSGTGSGHWTGSFIPTGDHPTGDDNESLEHYFDGGRHGLRRLDDLTISASDWTETRRIDDVSAGYGTLSVTGTVPVDGQTMRIRHLYELGASDSFVRITTEISNEATDVMENVHLWVGTRDDYVGTDDRPTKTRGNIVDGDFTTISDTSDPSSALQISSGAEGVLFYSTTDGTNTVHASCCDFSNSYDRDPTDAPVETTGDGSYAMYLPVGDLEPGASEEIVWFYAAGALDDLEDVIRDVAEAAAPDRPAAEIGNTTVTLDWEEPEVSEGAITGYEVRWSSDGGTTWTAAQPTSSTATTYTVTGLANGTNYEFQVRAVVTDGEDETRGEWSPSTLVATPGLPVSLDAPTIVGDPVVGATLTAVDIDENWANNGDEPLNATYQWFADGDPIAGATGDQLLVTEDLAGKQLSVVVTRGNDVGAVEAAAEATAEVPTPIWIDAVTLSSGTVEEGWVATRTATTIRVRSGTSTLQLTPTVDPGVTVTTGTSSVGNGEALTVSVPVGTTDFEVDVTGPGGLLTRYVLTIIRPARSSPAPEPEPEEEEVPEPVRTEEGALPDSGEAVVEVGGERQEVATTRTASGGVEVSGSGFSIAVDPESSDTSSEDEASSGSGDDGLDSPDDAATDGPDAEEPGAEDAAVGSDVDLTFVRGRAAEVSVSGFRPSSPVRVWLFSDPQLLGEFTTSGSGTLRAATDILGDDVSACRHTLHAEGELPSGQQVRLSLGVWVDAEPYPFADVRAQSVHRRAVACLADQQVVQGAAPGEYRPSGLTTRGQAASMFARWFDLAPTTAAAHADVVSTTHEDAIQALFEAGAVRGFDAEIFGPNRVVTRGQFASMLAGVLDLPAVETSSFADVGATHAGAVGALETAGVVSGFADGTFRASEPITRAQAASLVVRQQMAMG